MTKFYFIDPKNAILGHHAGIVWNGLPTSIRDAYGEESGRLEELHTKQFPTYKYQPKKRPQPEKEDEASSPAAGPPRPRKRRRRRRHEDVDAAVEGSEENPADDFQLPISPFDVQPTEQSPILLPPIDVGCDENQPPEPVHDISWGCDEPLLTDFVGGFASAEQEYFETFFDN